MGFWVNAAGSPKYRVQGAYNLDSQVSSRAEDLQAVVETEA